MNEHALSRLTNHSRNETLIHRTMPTKMVSILQAKLWDVTSHQTQRSI